MGDDSCTLYFSRKSEEKFLETQLYMEDNIELHVYDMRTWTCLILPRVASSISFHIIRGYDFMKEIESKITGRK
jgi:hypothetical protein